MPSNPDITAVVLAGGAGRRMGGVDKGLQTLAGKALVAHVIERIAPQVGALLIVANRNHGAYARWLRPGVDALLSDPGHGADAPAAGSEADYQGPLAGMHAGLSAASTPLVLCVPCDTPWLPEDLAARLLDALKSTAAAPGAVARWQGKLQPTVCLLRRSAVTALGAFLDSGRRTAGDFLLALGVTPVDFTAGDGTPFANINTREQLVAADSPVSVSGA